MISQKFVDLYARGAQVSLLVAERDVVLTYALRILADVGLLAQLALKGGTCIRKVYLGRSARFSEDLDFTVLRGSAPDDLILQVAETFDRKSYYDIAFSVDTADVYVRDDLGACGAKVGYTHAWNPVAKFDLDLSLREQPILTPQSRGLHIEGYFERLEIAAPTVLCLCLEEIIAEKIRAAYQRRRARDVFDLYLLQRQPFDRSLVRTLVVLKLWSVEDAFDPEPFLARLSSAQYEWDDLTRLIRRDQQPSPKEVIAGCLRGYTFLRDLTPAERALAQDRRRSRQDLFRDLTQRLANRSQ
jgi:predicted nucleotidyltransferase component of viral defense system